MILPVVKADVNPVYYTRNSTVNYTQPCINNGSLCSTAALCNVTILYANDSALIYNKNMTNSNNGFFSTLLYPNQTSMNGVYKSYIFCIDGTAKGYSINQFTITQNGQPPANNSLFIFINILFIIAVVLVITTLLIAFIKLAMLDYRLSDLLLALGSVLLLLTVIYLSSYIIDPFIMNFSNALLTWVRWSNTIFPVFCFFATFMYKAIKFKGEIPFKEIAGDMI